MNQQDRAAQSYLNWVRNGSGTVEMNTDREWLMKKAAQEDGQFIGVGGHILRKIESAEKQVTLAHNTLRKIYEIATRAQCDPGPDECSFVEICTIIEETGVIE